MDNNHKIAYGGVAVTVVGAISTKYIRGRAKRKKDREILEAMSPENRAIHIASARVTKRIKEGKLPNNDLDSIMIDFEFERIIAMEE